jgi:hypothetical protein
MSRRFDVAWLILWGVLSSAWCLSAAQDLSASFDEPFYLRSGLKSWRTGSNYDLMRAGTMPLPVDVEYLPIYLWERARGEPFDTERDFHTILYHARAMNLLFWWAQLTYGMLLARTFGGPWAGRFAVVLLATEPSLLGHACLATTDISVSAMILIFAYHYYHGLGGSRFRRWILPGILYGAAMAAKASALTFVPLMVLAFEIPRWHAAGLLRARPLGQWLRTIWHETYEFRCRTTLAFFIGMAVVWVYCGTDWKPLGTFVKQADAMPDDNRWAPSVRWLAHHLQVFPNAGEAFQYQLKHNLLGHGTNLLGVRYPRAVWYYFPVALSIKLSVPALALAALLVVARPRSLWHPLGLATLLFLLFSLNCRVQIGIRLVFPLVVILLVTLAVGAARASEAWSNRGKGILLTVLVVALAYPAYTAWPDGLRYANELWGGPDNTHLYLADSNSDWGQGAKDLDRWTEAHGLPKAKVWYYGMDPVIASDPERLLALHDFRNYNIESPGDTWKYVRGTVVAVGTTLLHGDPAITRTMPNVVEFFRGQQPIGHSRNFYIYDFRDQSDQP